MASLPMTAIGWVVKPSFYLIRGPLPSCGSEASATRCFVEEDLRRQHATMLSSMTRDHVLRRRADRGSGAARARGRLKIGDDWNAITIIALSQSNPMKAVAELIENCIDAKARSVTVTRGREGG